MRSAEVVAELEELTERVATIASGDTDGWPAQERSVLLLALLALQVRVHAAVLAAAAVWDGREDWRADGSLSAVPWLRRHGIAERDARQLVRSARLVRRNDTLAKSLAAGDVTAGHVGALARHVTSRRVEQFDEHADVLVDAARTLSVDDTAVIARRWAGYADDAANRGEPAQLHGRRGVWFHQTGELTEARVLGAPEDLAVLRAALERAEPPDRHDTPGGPRSLAQRRYDALVALAEVGLAQGRGRIEPAHTINVVIDDTTLTGELDPNGRSDIPGWEAVLPSSVHRLLCTSWLSRVLMGADGEVLDLGRRSRLFSEAQQRAIVIRDGGCVFDGCDRPPEWCDVHHLDPWGPPTHGETNLDNGISICRPHHTLVHQGWTPHKNPDGSWRLEPP